MLSRIAFQFVFGLCLTAPAAGQLVIDEFLAAGAEGLEDEDGDASDWIEILNKGPAEVNLAGWSLTDDPDAPDLWTFPDRLLGSGRYLVVFASGKDRRPAGTGTLHASFKLGSAGEYLGLFSPGPPRVVASSYSPRYPEQRTDRSYGLRPDGSAAYFDTPTPGAANSGALAFPGFVSDPVFGIPAGLRDDPFSLTISSPTPGASIRYTADGSEPTTTSGTLYGAPLQVEGAARKAAVVVRAVAYKSGLLPSNVVTATYIFPGHVPSQPADPAGFPTSWGAAPAVDYGMDPEITGDPQYLDMILETLRTLPTVSIVMDVDDLFGPQGIYSNPGGQTVLWERPGSAEFFPADESEGFQVNCGVRIQGGASREVLKSPKHSLRIYFKGDYGPTKLEHPLFPDSRVESFDVLIFRAGFNNSWIHWDGVQRNRAEYQRDQWVRDTQLDMGSLAPHGRFVHLYLNGLYWGLFNLVERPNAPFAAAYLGGEKEEYDALNAENTVDGDRNAWNTMLAIANGGVATEARYRAIQEYLDVPDLIDYMILHIYAGNQDWPNHNWYAVRRRVPGAGFKFASWDSERTIEDPAASRINVSDDGTPARLYAKLRENAEFRLLFADHIQRHFFDVGALTPGPAEARWMARREEIQRAVAAESARWGDYRRDVNRYSSGPYELYERDVHWIREESRVIDQYFPGRTATVLAQFRTAGLYPAIGAPILDPHGGSIGPGASVTMVLPAGTSGTIYHTTDGSDPRAYGTGEVSATASPFSGEVVLEDTTRLRARTLAGTSWSALVEAMYTVPAPHDGLRIAEIMYNPAEGKDLEYLEIVNLGTVTLDLSDLYFSNGIGFVFPPFSALGPGERVVLVVNEDAFAARYPGVPVGGVYVGSLDNGGEKVTLKDPSGRTVVSVDYDDDGFWPIGADGFGRSLVAIDPRGDPDDPENWRAGSIAGGTPGEDESGTPPGRVVVNEVLALASAPLEGAVELHNPTGADADIGGWFLSNSRSDEGTLKKFRIPVGTRIPAGGYTVFYEDRISRRDGAWPGFSLEPLGGAVYLSSADAAGNLTGSIAGVEFGASEDGVSFGRHRTSSGVDFTALASRTFGADDPATVEEFRLGTGRANSSPRIGPVVVNEIMYHPPEGGVEFVEIQNRTSSAVSLHDAALDSGWRLEGVQNALETDAFEFGPGASIPARGLLLLVGSDPDAFRADHAVPAEVPVIGPFGGALDNAGEGLKLLAPCSIEGGYGWVLVERVRYNEKAPWPAGPDGLGPSLERIEASDYADDPASWAASTRSGGTPGAVNSVSSPDGNQYPVASFTADPRSGTAPLQVAFDASASRDPDGTIASYEWDFGDDSGGAGIQASHGFLEAGSYTIRLTVIDDRGAAAFADASVTVGASAGGRVPGDLNGDASVDLSDVIRLILYLFAVEPVPLPCSGGTAAGEPNLVLADLNGDGRVNVSDAVRGLRHLFLSDLPPAAGTGCLRLAGCPEACTP